MQSVSLVSLCVVTLTIICYTPSSVNSLFFGGGPPRLPIPIPPGTGPLAAGVGVLSKLAGLLGGVALGRLAGRGRGRGGRRRGRREALEGDLDEEDIVEMESVDCMKRTFCVAATGKMKNPRMRSILKLLS